MRARGEHPQANPTRNEEDCLGLGFYVKRRKSCFGCCLMPYPQRTGNLNPVSQEQSERRVENEGERSNFGQGFRGLSRRWSA